VTARHNPLPNLTDVDLRLLRVFCAVVLNRGFAAAQRQLGISASNISVHIGQLEQRLSVRLCERGRKGFEVTDMGRVIFDAAVSLFRATDNFRGIVASARGALVGEIHFGFVDAVVTNRALNLEDAIAEFTRSAPDAQLNLDISSPQELIQGLVEERYHVVMSPQVERHALLTYIPFKEERKSLYCGRNHPLYTRSDESISLKEIAGTPAVARSYMNEWVVVEELKLQHSATASHMERVALMILTGRFIGHLPDHYAAKWVASG
jgi:DNA-binding transcriptional LysR family regulator